MRIKTFVGVIGLLILGSIFFYGCGNSNSTADQSSQNSSASYQGVSADQLKSMIQSDKTLVIVDVREQQEYDQGHLAGSKLIPLGEITSRLSELPKDKPIAVVCASGARSSQAATFLVQNGFSKVYNLSGGLQSWPDELVK